MDERPNLHEFLNEVSSFSDEVAVSAEPRASEALAPIGKVVEIAGSGSQVLLDAAQLAAMSTHSDPSMATSGQARLIEGGPIAAEIRVAVAEDVAAFTLKHGRSPGLAVVRAGIRSCRYPRASGLDK